MGDSPVPNLLLLFAAAMTVAVICTPPLTLSTEARGGLHVVEQSLWAAVPSFLRRLSTALKKHTGRELPLRATPIKFGSWMGGDRWDKRGGVGRGLEGHIWQTEVVSVYWHSGGWCLVRE